MAKQKMLIEATRADETRVALVKDRELLDFDFESASKKSVKSNIYLGKIVRIEPSLQAAFVEYGSGRHGFLAFTEIHPDYFRIPIADREELVESIEGEGTSEEETAPTPEDTQDDAARKKYLLYRNYKIQEVVKSKQVVLVQVVKEERGNKGAALTTFVSLAGRYSVLMPNALHAGGISRKITENEDRKRLKKMIADLGVPEGMSLIVRTAGIHKTKNEIKKDYNYLIDLWASIREKTLSATAPELIYEEPNLIKRVLRDVYNPDVEEVLVEGPDGYKDAKAFMKQLIPSHAKKVKQYKHADGLFKAHNVDDQIEQIFSPKVELPSGGYLVINATEALVAIDVNSGRATRERHIDSTALKTNLEAAEEVAKQVRIRDLSGLVVIDFIDMNEVRHNIAVEKRLKEGLSMDRARIQVGRISQFGLLEMSRQRLRSSILEANSSRCPYCAGSGLMRSKESLSVQLIRLLESLSGRYSVENPLSVHLDGALAFYLLSHKRNALDALQADKGAFFHFHQDHSLNLVGFRVVDKDGLAIADGTGSLLPDDKPEQKKKSSHQKESGRGKRSRGNSRNRKGRSSEDSMTKESSEVSMPTSDHQAETTTPAVASDDDDHKESADKNTEGNAKRGRRRRRRPDRNRGVENNNTPEDSEKREDSETKRTPETEEAQPPRAPSESESTDSAKQAPNQKRKKQKAAENSNEDQDQGPKPAAKDGWWKKLLD